MKYFNRHEGSRNIRKLQYRRTDHVLVLQCLQSGVSTSTVLGTGHAGTCFLLYSYTGPTGSWLKPSLVTVATSLQSCWDPHTDHLLPYMDTWQPIGLFTATHAESVCRIKGEFCCF